MTALTRRRLLEAGGVVTAAMVLRSTPTLADGSHAVAIAGDPNGPGYWVVRSNGRVVPAGSARKAGGARPGSRPAVGLAAHAGGSGFWRIDSGGTVTAHGRAPTLRMAGWDDNHSGSGRPQLGPVAGIAADARGAGYWIATRDGAVIPFGRSRSLDLVFLPQGVREIVGHPRSAGYWVLDRHGKVHGFGAADARGSSRDAIAMAAHPSGRGYWTVSRSGRVGAHGVADFRGDVRNRDVSVVGIAAHASGKGYWLLTGSGRVLEFPVKRTQTPEPDPPPGVGDVDVVTVGGVVVARSISRRVRRLLAAAADDGIRLGGWGYRSYESQVQLRRQNCGTSRYAIYRMPSSQCSPPTARPGSSMHERGLAIDFYRRAANGSAQPIAGTRAFRWLKRNAARYGLYNLPSEPWHWSTNGR